MNQFMSVTAVIFAVALIAPAVLAGDDWSDDERRLDIEQLPDGFELRSDRVAGPQHDRIRLELKASNVEYDFDLLEEVGAAVAEASLNLRLERIVEFRDENADGAFQAGESVRAEYDEGDLTLAAIDVADVSSGGVDGIQATATYDFTASPGSMFGFRATAFGNVTHFQGLPQTPVEIKLDLLFGDFPYTEADTRPGIELRVKAEAPRGPNVTADQLSFTTGNLTALFGWLGTADVDGAETPVGVTTLRQPDEVEDGEVEAVLLVTFAYVRGADIVHDPVLAFAQAVFGGIGGVLGNWGFYALGAVAAVGVFSGLALARKGRKVKRE